MAGGKSSWLQAQISQYFLGQSVGSIPAPPATWYFALSTELWTPDATGSSGMNEVSGSAYARLAVTNDTTLFPAPASSNPTPQSNAVLLDWPLPTGDWGLIKSIYMLDAAVAGNHWFGGDIGTPFHADASNKARAPINSVQLMES